MGTHGSDKGPRYQRDAGCDSGRNVLTRHAKPSANLSAKPSTDPGLAATAFQTFGTLFHWQVYDHPGPLTMGDAIPEVLARMKGAERPLVGEFIAHLLGATLTFAEAHDAWTRSRNDTVSITFADASEFRRFLIQVRETIDPTAWPIRAPGFRTAPSAGGTGPRRTRRPGR